MDHTYAPDADTGKCLDCPRFVTTTGCLWCGHPVREHSGEGFVDPAVLAHYQRTGTDKDGKPYTFQSVKWSPSACSHRHCACRTYERRGR